MKACALAFALAASSQAATPLLKGQTDRPLRYRPEAGGFVIDNGPDSFNRPLYGGHTAFRVDAGDRPEFSLYLPGRGGVLRVGISVAGKTMWLRDAATVQARYADAAMIYTISDPAWPGVTVRLTAVAFRDFEGLGMRADVDGAKEAVDLLFAFGGVTGEKGKRDGDIGTESVSVSEFFALKPDHCRDNAIDVLGNSFTLTSKAGKLGGVCSADATARMADARQWGDANALCRSPGGAIERPVMLMTAHTRPGVPIYFGIEKRGADAASHWSSTQPMSGFIPLGLDNDMSRAIEQNRAVARQLVIDTPDPFINSAASAMCVAADSLWDDAAHSFMHGGVAWRRPLLGWRGPYSGDALGWHDRTQQHLDTYFTKQSIRPPAATQPAADDDANLARSEKQLRTDGDLTDAHYDMNLVAIDALMRHLLWTGDLDYARKVWPVIQRHLAWEQRLLRRPFGPDQLPLYEAYAAIWASDDLQYSGGGVTHASAYNYYHNIMAARLATLLGEDGKPYRAEADAIRRAMRQELWLPGIGQFAECKDMLGLQRVHPDAGLWTYYHTIDSQVPDALDAWQMGRAIDTHAVHIPIGGTGVPTGLSTLSSTDWTPYDWSTNNVVMAETEHTALAQWQAGRPTQAFALFKAAILDSMFMGQCPGNLHCMSQFDDNRQEAQRDFGDPTGITSRALIEGLFGIQPDALAGELRLRPGFPADWDHASIHHVDLAYTFKRAGMTDAFTIEPHFAKPMRLRLEIPARGGQIAAVTVNGKPAEWRNVDDAIGTPKLELTAAAAERFDVIITWAGTPPAVKDDTAIVAAIGEPMSIAAIANMTDVRDPQRVAANLHSDGNRLTGTVVAEAGPHSLFVRVSQGSFPWWQPVNLDVRPAIEVVDTAVAAPNEIACRLRNNTQHAVNGEATIQCGSVSGRVAVAVKAMSTSAPITVRIGPLPTGRTLVAVTVDDLRGEGLLSDWTIPVPVVCAETLVLSPYFNDSVAQVFRNRYVSPRSPYCSLAIPTQGFGGWATNKTTPTIDDAGLRARGHVDLPSGVSFVTPTAAGEKNVLFVSQWDNYPREATVPLSGRASAVYLLMAGTTNPMQSRIDNGEVIVEYTDGTSDRLALRNPETWWPIEQDYFVDDYAFDIGPSLPPRVDLKTGTVRLPTRTQLQNAKSMIPGGAATVLNLPLDPAKSLKSLKVKALANDVVIGLMGVTLQRPAEMETNKNAATIGP